MDKIVNGVLIDPTSRSVKLVEVSEKVSLKECYKHLECDLIEMANPNSTFVDWRDTLIVDESGLLKDGQEFFKIGGKLMPVRVFCYLLQKKGT